VLQFALFGGHHAACQVQDDVGGYAGGEAAPDAAGVDEKDAVPALDKAAVRVTKEDDLGPFLAPLFEKSFHPIFGAIAVAVRHEDARAGDPQKTLEWKRRTKVAVTAHSIETDGRIRCTEGDDVSLAIPAMEHAGDFGMPKHRLLQVGRVAVRIRDYENMHTGTSGNNEHSMNTSIATWGQLVNGSQMVQVRRVGFPPAQQNATRMGVKCSGALKNTSHLGQKGSGESTPRIEQKSSGGMTEGNTV